MTPVESALCRCCLPPSLTASASTTFFTGLNPTARNAHCLRFGPGVAPSTARLASSCAFGLGWAGLATRRVSTRGFSSWQHPPQPDFGWRTREAGRRGDPRGQNLGFALRPQPEGPSPLWLSARATARSLKAQPALALEGEYFLFWSSKTRNAFSSSRTSPAPRESRSHVETEGRHRSFCDWGCGLAAKRPGVSTDRHGHVYGREGCVPP
jgi:hypothetical protein